MEILKVYYSDSGSKVDFTEEFAISDWYCRPAILSALAWRLEREPLGSKVLFLTCSKYGCRQFRPAICKSFPVYSLVYQYYKEGLPWLVVEFNSHAYDNVKD